MKFEAVGNDSYTITVNGNELSKIVALAGYVAGDRLMYDLQIDTEGYYNENCYERVKFSGCPCQNNIEITIEENVE